MISVLFLPLTTKSVELIEKRRAHQKVIRSSKFHIHKINSYFVQLHWTHAVSR